jgi:hypothetical protein
MTNTVVSAIFPDPRLAQASSNDTPLIPVRINAVGLAPKLNDMIDTQEIFALDAGISEAEGFDDRHQFVGIVVVSGNKDIEIAGVTWPPMECERPGADDHVLNTVRVQ